jgi:hypothetical protein
VIRLGTMQHAIRKCFFCSLSNNNNLLVFTLLLINRLCSRSIEISICGIRKSNPFFFKKKSHHTHSLTHSLLFSKNVGYQISFQAQKGYCFERLQRLGSNGNICIVTINLLLLFSLHWLNITRFIFL